MSVAFLGVFREGPCLFFENKKIMKSSKERDGVKGERTHDALVLSATVGELKRMGGMFA